MHSIYLFPFSTLFQSVFLKLLTECHLWEMFNNNLKKNDIEEHLLFAYAVMKEFWFVKKMIIASYSYQKKSEN